MGELAVDSPSLYIALQQDTIIKIIVHSLFVNEYWVYNSYIIAQKHSSIPN